MGADGAPGGRPVRFRLTESGTITLDASYLLTTPRLGSMTQLHVLLFASYADAFGTSSVTVTVPEPATVSDVVVALRELPGGDVLPPTPLVAVDRRYTPGAVPVHAGQEIAVIPPVAGG